jgi:hypothetical protein
VNGAFWNLAWTIRDSAAYPAAALANREAWQNLANSTGGQVFEAASAPLTPTDRVPLLSADQPPPSENSLWLRQAVVEQLVGSQSRPLLPFSGLADTRRPSASAGLARTVAPPVIDAVLRCDSCIFPHEGRGKKATVGIKVNKFLPQPTCG